MALATRRAELLLRSARKRERLSHNVLAFDTCLHIADDRITAARRSLASILAAGLVAAALLSLRRHGAWATLVRAALFLSAARRIGHLLHRSGAHATRHGFRLAPR